MKKILVIGSNCVTGSYIVDSLLCAGHEVHGVSRSDEYDDMFLPYKRLTKPNFKFYKIDIVKEYDKLFNLIKTIEPDTVIHVAGLSEVALSHEKPVEYFEVNTVATVRLCNYLRKCDFLKQYVYISTPEVFGSCGSPLHVDESYNPSSPYAASKAAAEMYIETLTGFPYTITRSTNIYGRGQQLYKIIPRTIICIKAGKKLKLHGGGKVRRSFIHISDVSSTIKRIVDKRVLGIIHMDDNEYRPIVDIVKMICNKMNAKFEDVVEITDDRSSQDSMYSLDATSLADVWSQTINIDLGLNDTISWVLDNWEEIQKQPLDYIHK